MITYLVCYDIEDDRERVRIAKCLEHYGLRVQYSVFEVHLSSKALLKRLRTELKGLVTEPADIRFYRLTQDALGDCQALSGQPIGRRELAIIV